MKSKVGNIFKPAASRSETKADRTTEAVRAIVKSEVAKRNAKTERLRAARLAMEADEPVEPVVEKKKARATKAAKPAKAATAAKPAKATKAAKPAKA